MMNNNNFIANDIGDRLMMGYYVKYDHLKNLINTQYVNSNANHINLFIDLNSIFKSMNIANNSNIFVDRLSIVSRIINMCAHYRYFFSNRYRVTSKIFLLYNEGSIGINRKLCAEYNIDLGITSPIYNIIQENLEMLSILVPYINDIHFIKTNYEVGVRVLEIIDYERTNLNNNYPNIVITKDIYNIQLSSIIDDTIILRPKKVKGEDQSFIINDMNIINSYSVLRNNKMVPNIINPKLMSFIMAMTRLPERNLKSISSVSKTVKIINTLISDNKILNDYNSDIKYIVDLYNKESKSLIDPYLIEQRFNCIDLYNQYMIYKSAPDINIYNGIVNLYDPNAVKDINNKYFKNVPLDLNVL